MNKSAGKFKITSYDDLFGSGGADEAGLDRVIEVPLADLHPFKDHPFRVLDDDEKMEETVQSIQKYGVLNPGIVRLRKEGGYEIISGHRRKRGCELAGRDSMPVIVRDYTDDEAVVIMVDANIQREDILPSEKAKAYKMKYEALKHQGSRGERHTADEVGGAAGDSGRTVQRYIRLAELTQELMDYVDGSKILLIAGEKLSFLKGKEQEWVANAIRNSGVFPSKAQAEQLKESSGKGELTEGAVYAVLVKKESGSAGVNISARRIREFFPNDYTKEQVEEVIYTLLEEWKQNGEREGF